MTPPGKSGKCKGYVSVAVIVDDDEIDKRRVKEALLSEFPDARFKFYFQPDDLPRCS
jgi:hypothetical protein